MNPSSRLRIVLHWDRHLHCGPRLLSRWLLTPVLALWVAMPACSPPPSDVGASRPPEAVPLDPAIRAAAMEQGRAIVAEAFSLLSSNLQTALQQGGVSNALPFCSVAALPITDSVAKSRGIILRRVSHKARNPANRANPAELGVIQSFENALTVSTNIPPIVTNLAPGQVSFFAPIVIPGPLCLNCHGVAGQDILPANMELIRRLYPADQAVGFSLGQLRGAWRIDFPAAAFSAAAPLPP